MARSGSSARVNTKSLRWEGSAEVVRRLALWVIGDSLNGLLDHVGEVATADQQEHGRLGVEPYDVAEQLVDRSGD